MGESRLWLCTSGWREHHVIAVPGPLPLMHLGFRETSEQSGFPVVSRALIAHHGHYADPIRQEDGAV